MGVTALRPLSPEIFWSPEFQIFSTKLLRKDGPPGIQHRNPGSTVFVDPPNRQIQNSSYFKDLNIITAKEKATMRMRHLSLSSCIIPTLPLISCFLYIHQNLDAAI